jgi:hypothetical protein
VSGFLLEFFPRIKGLMERFRDKGVPFRHYLLRTVRWHWTSYLIAKNHAEANAHLLQEPNHLSYDDSFVDSMDVAESPEFEPQPQVHQKRLVSLALKSAAYLEDLQVEEVCRRTGTDLAWLQSKVDQIKSSVESQAGKVKNLTQRQGEVYWQRLVAEDRVRRDDDDDVGRGGRDGGRGRDGGVVQRLREAPVEGVGGQQVREKREIAMRDDGPAEERAAARADVRDEKTGRAHLGQMLSRETCKRRCDRTRA